jgi:hypothetical protein
MNYPIHLMPCINYKKIDTDLNAYFLIREIKNPSEDIIDELTGLIHERFIAEPTKRVVDYSTSLLGVFKVDDLKIEMTSLGKEIYARYCEPSFNIEIPPIFNEHFYIKEKIDYFFLEIGKFQNAHFNYSDSNCDKNGKCIVEHTPFLWNYWHFSLNWTKEDGTKLQNNDKELKKSAERSICSIAKKMIRMHAIYHKEIDFKVLPDEFYKI